MERWNDGLALYAFSGSQAAGARGDAQAGEHQMNIYSLTLGSGEGASAKMRMKSMMFF
jgi:hypothetical protein